MKPILLLVALTWLFNSNARAQGLFNRFKQERSRNPPSAAKVVGCIAIPVGAIAALYGFLDLSLTGIRRTGDPERGPDPLGVGLVVGGCTFIAGGITLLIVDAHHHKKNRWSVIVPKKNEIGLAYNF